jgi:ParB-like nuclease domain
MIDRVTVKARHRHARDHGAESPAHGSATAGMVRIADIKIGHRHRKDLGDIPALARNIFEEVGALLHPVVITPDGRLVAGARRIAAFRYLGRDMIPVTVIDIKKVALGEYAENVFHKAFTPSEMADIADTIEPLERAEAEKRQCVGKGADGSGGRGKRKNLGGTSPKVSGRALDKVAKIVGKDRKTIQKARAVRDAAKADPTRFGKLQEDDPTRFGKLQEDMDRTGRVNGVHRRLKILQQAEAIRKEPPPLPGNGPYRVIAVDAAWRYEKRADDSSQGGRLPIRPCRLKRFAR